MPKGKASSGASKDQARGVLVSDVASKCYHSHLRGHGRAALESHVPDTQCGGMKGRGTDLASLGIRMFFDAAKKKAWSAAVLYVDICSAFDSVVRQFVTGDTMTEHDLVNLVESLCLAPHVKENLHKFLEGGDALSRMGLPEDLASAIRGAHENTWFSTQGCSTLVETLRGSRPGDPLGDFLYQALQALAIQEVRERLRAAELCCHIPYSANEPLLLPVQGEADELVEFSDVGYVDDECFVLWDASATRLVEKISQDATIVAETFSEFGLQLNLSAGKTEVSIVLRGNLSRRLRQKILIEDSGSIKVDVLGGVRSLRVVATYKHLGAQASVDTCMGPELQHRRREGVRALGMIKHTICHRREVSMSTRRQALQSLFGSRLLHNSGTWPKVTALLGPLRALWTRGARMVASGNHGWREDFFELDVLGIIGLPPIETVIAQSRLRMAARFSEHAPKCFRALAQFTADCAGAWPQQVRLDMEWARCHSGYLADLGPYERDHSLWHSVMACRAEWKDIVKRCCHPRATAIIIAHAPLMHTSTLGGAQAPVGDLGADGSLLAAHAASVGHCHVCEVCNKGFASTKCLGAHRWQSHGLRNPIANWIKGTQCLRCNVEYHTRARLLGHLTWSSPLCSLALSRSGPPLSLLEVGREELQEQVRQQALRAQGRSRRWAELPAYRGEHG